MLNRSQASLLHPSGLQGLVCLLTAVPSGISAEQHWQLLQAVVLQARGELPETNREGLEYIPLRHYYHRHTRSIFWELQVRARIFPVVLAPPGRAERVSPPLGRRVALSAGRSSLPPSSAVLASAERPPSVKQQFPEYQPELGSPGWLLWGTQTCPILETLAWPSGQPLSPEKGHRKRLVLPRAGGSCQACP